MYSADKFSNFQEESSDKIAIGPSKTLQVLCLFAHKFLYPMLYTDYNITEEQFETLLDLIEEKISDELNKVEKEVNLSDEEMDDEMKTTVEEQFNCLIDSGELFLAAIEEMRMYLESEDEEEGKKNLLKGIELARRADQKLRRSLEIFEELRETH